MVASNGKAIPKGAKVTNAALHKPKRGDGGRRVRLFFTDAKHNKKWDFETPYEEHSTRKVTDPQDTIAKYKDYILHCWEGGKDFEWPMTSSMKIDCNTWQKGLRDQDPATRAPAEYYKKETFPKLAESRVPDCPPLCEAFRVAKHHK